MELLTPVVTGALLAVFTVVLHLLVKGQIDSLRRELTGEFTREITGLRARIERVETQIDAMRSDLTQVALAVGAKLRPQTG